MEMRGMGGGPPLRGSRQAERLRDGSTEQRKARHAEIHRRNNNMKYRCGDSEQRSGLIVRRSAVCIYPLSSAPPAWLSMKWLLGLVIQKVAGEVSVSSLVDGSEGEGMGMSTE